MVSIIFFFSGHGENKKKIAKFLDDKNSSFEFWFSILFISYIDS